jgi:tetratricopeptide (TPR) repeat protein
VDCDRAIELNPPMIFPYPYATAVALRNGQINEAAAFIKIVVQDFPDPYYATRIMQTYQGNIENNPVAPFYSAYANLALGQYQQVIQDTNMVLEIIRLADVYLVQGLAYCNLGKYDDALDSYSEGINLEPDYAVLYLLRSEIQARQGNMEALLNDVAVIQQSPLNEILSPYVQAGMAGDFSCETFFDFDYESILEEQ